MVLFVTGIVGARILYMIQYKHKFPETDLLGAHRAGLRSVFIASPIFVPEGLDAGVLTKLFGDRPFAPEAALEALVW